MPAAEDKYVVRYDEHRLLMRDCEELRSDMYGNGKKGIKTELISLIKDVENNKTELEIKMDNLIKNVDDKIETHKKIITSKLNFNNVITSVVFLALVLNLIKGFF